MKHEYGITKYANGGISYEGEYHLGKAHGFGISTTENGYRFIGIFEDGYRTKKGIDFDPDGRLVRFEKLINPKKN